MYKTFIIVIVSLFFINDDFQLIHFSDSNYKYIVRVTEKKLSKVDQAKKYYWFKARNLHSSVGGYSGMLLDGKFEKFYKNNQLAERGEFIKGLKNSKWISWFENGQKHEIINWKSGVKEGGYKKFNDNGLLILIGKFNHGRKNDMWVDYIKKDTLYYKKGKIIDKPISFFKKTSLFFKNIFSKKEKK